MPLSIKSARWFVLAAFACAVIGWKVFFAFEGSEFGSGELAGNAVVGSQLFVLAAALIFKLRRTALLVTLLASYWSLPLYLYLVFPAPFRGIWPSVWKSPTLPTETFVWDVWWIAGIVATLCATALGLLSQSRKPIK